MTFVKAVRLRPAVMILAVSAAVAWSSATHAQAPEPYSPAMEGKEPAPPVPPSEGSVRWTLDNVIATALSRHPQVSQADADTAAAHARVGQARSTYYPSVNLSAGYVRSQTFPTDTRESITSESASAQGTVSMTIADFGRTRASVARSAALLSSAREGGRTVREDVAFNAKTAYFDVLRAQRLLSVNRETVRQRESLFRQAQAFYEAGIRAKIDVTRAEANLFGARADLTSAENALRVARITLLNRMGVDGPRAFTLEDTLATEIFPGTMDEWVIEAEGNRPELRSLLERERASEMNLRGARAGYHPILAGNGAAGFAGEEFSLEPTYSVSVQLTVPVFTGFLTREQVREAEAALASARYATTDFRRTVRLQVEQAGLAMRESSERIGARKKEHEASEENLRLATARYEVGAGDIIEMIDAQVQNTRADQTYIEALYDYSTSVASLLRAIGR